MPRTSTARALLCASLLICSLTAQSAPLIVRIVGAAPLTGPQAARSIPIRNGALLAVEEAKSRFSKLGVKLEFVSADDGASEDLGMRVAQRVASDPSVLGVVGHVNSSVSLRAMQVYARSELLMVSAASTSPNLTTQKLTNVARVCGRDDVQGPIAAQFVRDTLNHRRVFVVHDGTEYGAGLAKAFRARASAIGLSIVGFVTLPTVSPADAKPLEPSFWQGLAQQIKLYQPQAVYYSGVDPQGGALVKALSAAKYAGSIIAPDGIDTDNFVKLAGPAAKGVYYTSTAGLLSLLPNATGFIKRFQARFNTAPESYSAYAYDAANVVVEAIWSAFKAGNKIPTRGVVSKAARATEISGVTGRIGFTAGGDRRVADYFVLQFKTATYPGVVVRKLSSAPPAP